MAKTGGKEPRKTMNIRDEQTETLKEKDFLTLANLSTEEILGLIERAKQLKQAKLSSILQGKTLGMIFEKPSTRTRVSFEVGTYQLGGHALYLNRNDMQLGRGETIADTARILSCYVDAILIRTFEHDIVEELAKWASVPVINGLTNDYHPCQVLADLLTISEKLGGFNGKKLVYAGDGNNMAHSLMIGAAKVGMDCTIASPEGFKPKEEIVKKAKAIAEKTGGAIHVTGDPYAEVKEADVIYTDVWASMGDEQEESRLEPLAPFQVNETLMAAAKAGALFMHCLPAHRGEEATHEVVDGPQSIVFEQAENRLHAQKALLASIVG
jgi:ornithine carbamoyltransferase